MDMNLTGGNVVSNSKDTILIADDMEMNREILAEVLKLLQRCKGIPR